MKNKNIITFIFAITLSCGASPVFAWHNDTIYVQGINDQNIINSLNGINDSITKSTEALQGAQMQQKMDSLDQTCVKDVTEYIKGRDTGLKNIDAQIKSLTDQSTAHGMSDPAYAMGINGQLNDLYLVRGNQNKAYVKMVIDSCTNYKPAPVKTNDQLCKDSYGNNSGWFGKLDNGGKNQCECVSGSSWDNIKKSCVTIPTKTNDQICQSDYGNNSIWDGKLNDKGGVECGCVKGFDWNTERTSCVVQAPVQTGTLCNGKYWGDCTDGKKFYCPSTGDPQCLDQSVQNIQSTNIKTEVLPVITKQEVGVKPITQSVINKTKAPTVIKVEKKEVAPAVSPAPVKKWYQKIFSWF